MLRKYLRYVILLVAAIGFSSANAGAYEDFFRALSVDNASTVNELLSRGFDPNSRSESGQTPLYLSMREGSFKVATLLLQHTQTRLDLPNNAGETALMMAALRGQAEWVGRLLDKGARIEGLAQPGWTPLHYAASCEQASGVIRLLLDRGASINSRSPNGSTPLMMAARYGHESAVLELLQRGADVRLKNDLNLNAADFAKQGGREALADRLTKAMQ
jgi:hypothetical protein